MGISVWMARKTTIESLYIINKDGVESNFTQSTTKHTQ